MALFLSADRTPPKIYLPSLLGECMKALLWTLSPHAQLYGKSPVLQIFWILMRSKTIFLPLRFCFTYFPASSAVRHSFLSRRNAFTLLQLLLLNLFSNHFCHWPKNKTLIGKRFKQLKKKNQTCPLYWQSTLKSNTNTILTSFFPGKVLPLPSCLKKHVCVYIISLILSLTLSYPFHAYHFAYAHVTTVQNLQTQLLADTLCYLNDKAFDCIQWKQDQDLKQACSSEPKVLT